MKHSIFSSAFWRAYWVSLRRSKKDSRDRKLALRLSVLILFFILYYGSLLWNARAGFDAGTGVIASIFAFFFVTAILGRWVNNKLDERKSRRESDQFVNKDIRNRLASDGFALSVVLARAGSEQMLREKQMPSGIEVITRRTHLDQLRKLDIWNGLDGGLRNLLLMPDGHWPENIIDLWQSFETLRCIRWVLRLDERLEPLTYLPKMDYRSAFELTEKPARLLSGAGMVDTWDIRVERNEADAFFSRCYAEGIGRGIMTGVNADTHTWAAEVFDAARDSDRRDVLVAYDTVGELNEDTLRYVSGVSFQRYHCLQLIMNLIDGIDSWEEWTALCFPILQKSEQVDHGEERN
ncbi:hypothetical protein EDE15_5107 [Edaphobacter aggregans]|uniref:Uncharacterized protein n=1 Tax=Edaphobacter aggregans TaxID=570835 RepID=A0A428MRC2_9BACT|nr:hypothetical protein [Edaphobacter aggregans]RSL19438.1 hypothetical protein EDE15_5107 [Edaphobacter aggregans]